MGLLQQLRIDALHNSLVETDVKMLRTHLILLARRIGINADNTMPGPEFFDQQSPASSPILEVLSWGGGEQWCWVLPPAWWAEADLVSEDRLADCRPALPVPNADPRRVGSPFPLYPPGRVARVSQKPISWCGPPEH